MCVFVCLAMAWNQVIFACKLFCGYFRVTTVLMIITVNFNRCCCLDKMSWHFFLCLDIVIIVSIDNDRFKIITWQSLIIDLKTIYLIYCAWCWFFLVVCMGVSRIVFSSLLLPIIKCWLCKTSTGWPLYMQQFVKQGFFNFWW